MNKPTEFGKKYAEVIKANTKNSKNAQKIKTAAYKTFKEAKRKHKVEKLAFLLKLKEKERLLDATREERVGFAKEKKLAKNKARRERQAKEKEKNSVIAAENKTEVIPDSSIVSEVQVEPIAQESPAPNANETAFIEKVEQVVLEQVVQEISTPDINPQAS